MRLLSWLSQSQTGGVNKPLLRTRLTLGRLDERIVPDGTAPTPPDGPPGQTGDPGNPPVEVGSGQTVFLGQFAACRVYVSNDEADYNWITTVDPTTGSAISVMLGYDPTEFELPTEGVSADYQPDTTSWSLVWNADVGVWARIPPGGLTESVGRGSLVDGVNVIYADVIAARAAAPPTRIGPRFGGWAIEGTDTGGIIVTDPLGNQYSVHPLILTPPRAFQPYEFLFTPFYKPRGDGPSFTVPTRPPTTGEPPIAPKPKPPMPPPPSDDPVGDS